MQLKVNEVQLPAPITFNYEELRQELLAKAEGYASLVYTEDQIKFAKEDRANLNRLKKALNDERLKREREYMEPFSTFKKQIAEIVSIIDKASVAVDSQVKSFEDKQRADKLEQIQDYFEPKPFHDLLLSQIFDDKWLNASFSMKSIEEAIDSKLEQIEKDLAVVRSLPSYAFEAEARYKQSLNLAEAVSEAHRLSELAEKKAAWEAEQEKRKAEIRPAVTPEEVAGDFIDSVEKVEVQRKWIGFQALLSVDEAKALSAWLKAMNIEYKAV